MNTENGLAQYRRLNDELRKETDKAREIWWTEQCNDIENLEKKGQFDLLYKKIREVTGVKTNKIKGISIKDENGNLLTDTQEIKKDGINTLSNYMIHRQDQ